jgi:D-aminoacyl-tRNA deacylase
MVHSTACIVYSTADIASFNIAGAVKEMMDFEEAEPAGGYRRLVSGHVDMIEIGTGLIEADFIDKLVKTDLVVFLSRHSSSKNVASFTTHALGNWSDSAEFGGRPKSLGMASPVNMMVVLREMNEANTTGIPVTYEATHHGPLLDTPSLFVEIGGGSDTVGDTRLAGTVAKSVVAMISKERQECEKVVIGIGGTHYPEKFTKLALGSGYAFAHIMPRYNINVDMLQKAVERSDSNVESAVMEWKSIKAEDRDRIIRQLEGLGLDYERV